MPQIINSNIASLTAQRNLNSSQSSLNTSLQRLSSGLRINSARDDAAGLAISERFSTQIRGLNQAARNANDGISLAQTAEGDLNQVTNNLQRIRELAVQSANATNSASDRAALQLEVSQLVEEIDRVASTSNFNGVNLLNGGFTSQSFQVGANAGEVVTVASIASAQTADLGQSDSATYSDTQALAPITGAALSAGDLLINGNDVGAVTGDAAAIAAAINTATSGSVTATATSTVDVTFNDVVGAVATPANATTLTFGAFTEGVAQGTVTTQGVSTSDNPFYTSGGTSGFDFSVSNVTFDVTVDGGSAQTVTLDQNYADQQAVLDDIASQVTGLSAQAGGGDPADGVRIEGGNIVFESATLGTGSTVSVSGFSNNAVYEANEFLDVGGGNTDVAGDATNNIAASTTFDNAVAVPNGADFSVNQVELVVNYDLAGGGATQTTITLDQNYVDQNAILSDIETQLNAATGIGTGTATVDGEGQLVLSLSSAAAALDGDAISIDSIVTNLATGEGTVPGTDVVIDAAPTDGVTGATTDGTLTLSVDGTQIFSETAVPGGTVDATEVTNALSTFAAGDANYTFSGTIGVDAVLSRLDGEDTAITIGGNFTGTPLAFNTSASTNGDPAIAATNPDYTFTVNGTGINVTTEGSDGTLTGTELAAAITSQTDLTASYAGTTLTVTTADGANIDLSDSGNDSDGAEGLAGGAGGTGTTNATVYGQIDLVSQNVDLVVGGAAPAAAGLTAGTFALSGTLSGTTVANTDISTVNGANTAIASIDNALTTINNSRASLGAIQNRFDSVVSSIQTTSENLSAARSRIRDADFASETAALTRNQILQQAGVSILAQANALPQLALSLLQ